MQFFSVGFMLSIALFVTSCSSDDNTSSINDVDGARANPVIVTMGGFNSCNVSNRESTPAGNERWQKSEELSKKFAQGPAKWMRSCFDKWGSIHYISSLSPTSVRTATIDTLDNFIATIAFLTDHGKNPVFIIGHSHGGWLALTTAHRLPAEVNIKSLSTVDPISPRNCTPTNYIAALASPILSGFALAGCREAPSDITETVRGSILDRTPERAWRHYYQRNFLPLASSAFPGGSQPHLTQDLSPFLSNFPSGAHPSINAHTGIDQLSIVWYSFEVSISQGTSEG